LTDEKQSLLTPVMRWFLFAMVLANVASNMYVMLLPVFLKELGASVAQVGLVFTLSSLVPLALQIFGGWISDSIGRLRAIAIGSVGGVIGQFMMVASPTWQWMLVAISIASIARAFVGPSFGAFIAEQSTEVTRGRVYGLSGTIFQVVSVIGPPLGGFIAFRYGFRYMLLVSAILYCIAALIRIWMARTARFKAEKKSKKLSIRTFRTQLGTMIGLILSGGLVTWIFITDGVGDIAWRLSDQLFPLYLNDQIGLTVAQIGLLEAVFGIAMMTATLPAGWLSDKIGERITIMIGFFLVFLGFVFYLQSQDIIGVGIAWAVFGLGVGGLVPPYDSIVSKAVPEHMRGTAFGLFRTSLGVISLPSPWIGAQLWERFNPKVPFQITSISTLITIVIVWFKFKLPENGKAVPEVEPAD
jgi:MFS family permease